MKKTFLFLSLLLSLNFVQAMQQNRSKIVKKAAPSKLDIKQKLPTKTSNQARTEPEAKAESAKPENKLKPVEQKKAAAKPQAAKAPEKPTAKPAAVKSMKSAESSKPKAKSDISTEKDKAKIDVNITQNRKKRSPITAILPNNEQLVVFGNQVYVAKKDAQGVFIKAIGENGKFKNFYDKNLVENSKYRVRAKKNENVKIDPTKVVPLGYHNLASGEKQGLYLVMQKRKA
jgi:hypothetical protein